MTVCIVWRCTVPQELQLQTEGEPDEVTMDCLDLQLQTEGEPDEVTMEKVGQDKKLLDQKFGILQYSS